MPNEYDWPTSDTDGTQTGDRHGSELGGGELDGEERDGGELDSEELDHPTDWVGDDGDEREHVTEPVTGAGAAAAQLGQQDPAASHGLAAGDQPTTPVDAKATGPVRIGAVGARPGETTRIAEPAAHKTTAYGAGADEPGGYDPADYGYQPGAYETTASAGGYETAAYGQGAYGPGASHSAADEPSDEGAARRPRRLRRTTLVAAGVLAVLGLAYAADVLTSTGEVPRGVTVAGVDIGGMSEERAADTLRAELEPRLTEPVLLTAGELDTELDPAEAGLSLDWSATIEQAGQQPLNPYTRVMSFFSTREVGVVGTADDEQLSAELAELVETELERDAREGDIAFEPLEGTDGGMEAVAVEPRSGQQVADIDAAAATLRSSWLDTDGVELPVEVDSVVASPEGVAEALESVAEPAVAAGITFEGDGADAALVPAEIAEALAFEPEEDGSLAVSADEDLAQAAVEPALAETEEASQNAEVVFSGGEPTVQPSTDGRVIEWEPTLEPFLEVAQEAGEDDRVMEVRYADEEPEVTTEEAEALGIDEVIGEFTTSDFAEDSGRNIRRVADEVDGAIVAPGETFSLNGHTGPRTADGGYEEAGIIEDGVPGRAVGGGISQFATTLYNASYFAGMVDAGHTEHSFYIDRYPEGREATVFQAPGGGGIDLAFTNDAETGVAIQTEWSPSDITVRIWGTERFDVESITGSRTNEQEAGTRRVDDPDCEPSPGGGGFTVTDTRVLRDADSGEEVRQEDQTVTYDPTPEIICTDDD